MWSLTLEPMIFLVRASYGVTFESGVRDRALLRKVCLAYTGPDVACGRAHRWSGGAQDLLQVEAAEFDLAQDFIGHLPGVLCSLFAGFSL